MLGRKQTYKLLATWFIILILSAKVFTSVSLPQSPHSGTVKARTLVWLVSAMFHTFWMEVEISSTVRFQCRSFVPPRMIA